MTTLELLGTQLVIRLRTALSLSLGVALLLVIAVTVLAKLTASSTTVQAECSSYEAGIHSSHAHCSHALYAAHNNVLWNG